MFTTIQEVSTEPTKLRILNTANSLLAYPALLAGYRSVQEAIANDCLNAYLHTSLVIADKSLGDSLADDDLDESIDLSIDQLLSSEVSHPLSVLSRDGASKLPAFVMPVLLDRLEQGKEVSSFAFLLAAYGHYLQAGVDDKGEEYTVDEPALTNHDWAMLANGDVVSLLDISAFASARLRSFPQFVSQYKSYRNQIACYGLIFSLKQTLCAFWEEEPEAHR